MPRSLDGNVLLSAFDAEVREQLTVGGLQVGRNSPEGRMDIVSNTDGDAILGLYEALNPSYGFEVLYDGGTNQFRIRDNIAGTLITRLSIDRGVAQINSHAHIVPNVSSIYNLGSSSRRWNDCYMNVIDVNQVDVDVVNPPSGRSYISFSGIIQYDIGVTGNDNGFNHVDGSNNFKIGFDNSSDNYVMKGGVTGSEVTRLSIDRDNPNIYAQNIQPLAGNTYTIGSSLILWNSGWFNSLRANSIQGVSGTLQTPGLEPVSNGVGSLGSSNKLFNSLYANDIYVLGTSPSIHIQNEAQTNGMRGSVSGNTFTMESLTGGVYSEVYRFNDSIFVHVNTPVPDSDGSTSLGLSNRRWSEIHGEYALIRASSGNTDLRVVSDASNPQIYIGDDTGGAGNGSVLYYSSSANKSFLGGISSGTTNLMLSWRSSYLECRTGFIPILDNSYDLGTSANRWREIFCVNSAINTSDRRLKKDIGDISESLATNLINAIQPRRYKWIDNQSDRWHAGLIAQELNLALTSAGLNPADESVWVQGSHGLAVPQENGDPIESNLKPQGIRYSELIPYLIKYIQSLNARITALEGP